jgi:hypothetical protein
MFGGDGNHFDPGPAWRGTEYFPGAIGKLPGETRADGFAWAQYNFNIQNGHWETYSSKNFVLNGWLFIVYWSKDGKVENTADHDCTDLGAGGYRFGI